jgi:hypothetical protein
MSGPSPTCGPISVETNPGQQALISKLGFSRAKMAVMELMHTLTWNIRSRTIHPNLDIPFWQIHSNRPLASLYVRLRDQVHHGSVLRYFQAGRQCQLRLWLNGCPTSKLIAICSNWFIDRQSWNLEFSLIAFVVGLEIWMQVATDSRSALLPSRLE